MDHPALVQDKTPQPQGLLPKRVQSWLLIGLAFLMVAIMWLTGGKKPPTPARTPLSPVPAQAPLEVNETQIAQLQSRIEELQRQQLLAQSALAQQTHLLGATAQGDPQSPEQTGVSPAPDQRPEDPIEAERKRRAYVALFASNVALSYRTPPRSRPLSDAEAPHNPPTPLPETDTTRLAQLLKETQPSAMPPAQGYPSPATARNDSTDTAIDRKQASKNSAEVSVGVTNAAAGKTYILLEGTILETVLINRLDGQFAGPVECLLSTDVYSSDRQHLLVPAGSRLLGEAKKVDTFGQTRLAVVFHRLLMPDGYSVSLDQFRGLNQSGDTGLRDQVNNHYLRIFGVSLAIGALGAVAEGRTAGSLNASGSDLLRQGFAQSAAQSSAQILDKFLNVVPTVTIREGHRVKVYLAGDLALPDYNNHKMPSDL